MGILVDTDVLVNFLRGDLNTIRHLEGLEDRQPLSISVVTQMELIVGCQDKGKLRKLNVFIQRFEILPMSDLISGMAVELLQRYRLSHGLLLPDSLIAATAMISHLPLLTLNQRDFRFIDGLKLNRA